MKKIFCFALFILIVGCGSKKTTPVQPNTDTLLTPQKDSIQQNKTVETMDNRIMDTIASLPEVKERGNYIEKQTKGKNHLTITIAERPDDNKEDFYMVEVGEDNGSSVVTHFNFFVYSPSMEIKYLEPVSGEEITLKEWRNQLKK